MTERKTQTATTGIEFFFFFSSRRRHTRSLCDWSSDVCSSDLKQGAGDETQRDLHCRSDPFFVKGVFQKKAGCQQQNKNPDAKEPFLTDGDLGRGARLRDRYDRRDPRRDTRGA